MGVFATKDINANSHIVSEDPLFVIEKPISEISEAVIQRAFHQLKPEKKTQFLGLRENGDRPS